MRIMNIFGLSGIQKPTVLHKATWKNSVLRVTGLKILGRVGTHIFSGKILFYAFWKHFAFQNA